MKNLLLLNLFLLFSYSTPIYSQNSAQVNIKWYGHSSFMMTSSQGTMIATDPVNKWYNLQPHQADIVTVSHNHIDHNAVQIFWNSPTILYGKTRDEIDPEQKFIKVDETIKDAHIFSIESNHFKAEHSPCLNAIFIFEFDGLRIAHLGDIGRVLTNGQLAEIGKIDILMIPIGGYYTVEFEDADYIIKQLNPKIVLPMHYRNDVVDFVPNTMADFLNGKNNIKKIGGNEFLVSKLELPDKPTYFILDYK